MLNRRQGNFDASIRALAADNTPESLDKANKIIRRTIESGSGDISTDRSEKLISAIEESSVLSPASRSRINPKKIRTEFEAEIQKERPSVGKLNKLAKMAERGSDSVSLVNQELSSTLENLASDIKREAGLQEAARDVRAGDGIGYTKSGDAFTLDSSYLYEFNDFNINEKRSLGYVKQRTDPSEYDQYLAARLESTTDPALRAAIIDELATSSKIHGESVSYVEGTIEYKDGRENQDYRTLKAKSAGQKESEVKPDEIYERLSAEAIEFFKSKGIDLEQFVPISLAEIVDFSDFDDTFKTQPFPEAIELLRSKITLDTDSWRDIAGDEADAFFTVAGAKGSLLSEVRSLTEQAITEGWRPEQFRERFEQTAAGWQGNSPWRADLIYRTNVRQSYARGREEYQFDPDVLAVFPYLRYQHSDAGRPRPLHKALDQQIFPAQEIPFTCPNGYGCGCRYTSATEEEAEAAGVSSIRRGETIPTEEGPQPVEPDEGFDRTPGAARGEERDRIIQRVIDRSPPTIAAQIAAAIAAYQPPSTPPLEPPIEAEVPMYKGTPIAVLELENRIREQRFESAAVYDSFGDEVFFKDGEQFAVSFEWDEVEAMKGRVFTHNHPRGWGFPVDNPLYKGNSFSEDDWDLATAGVSEMRAVSPGWRHSVKAPPQGWPSREEMEKIFKAAQKREMSKGNKRIQKAQMTAKTQEELQLAIDNENANVYHNIAVDIAKRIGATYVREEFSEAPWQEGD